MYDVMGHQGQQLPASKTSPLYVDVDELSPLNSNGLYSNGLFMKRSYSQGKSHDLHLNMEELSLLRGDLAYDDLDLVSECDTPCAYSPGRYLQLHDDSLSDLHDDVTLWPMSPDTKGGRDRTWSHSDDMVQQDTHTSTSRHPTLVKSPKFFLPLLLCVFLAFSMLGGLMTVVT